MKLKIRQTEIEISYLLLCTAAAAVILNVFQSFVYCAAAVVIHESGHLIAMKRIGYFPKRIKISLFEINIRDDSRQLRTAKENMLIIFFGPAANFICFLPAFLLYLIGTDRIFPFAAANLSVGLFNLLPMMSLDGGQLLYLCLSRRMSPVQAEKTGNNSQKWLFDTPTIGKGWQKVAGGYRYSDGRGNLFMNAGEIIADSAFDRNNPGKYFFAHEIAVGDPIYQRIYGRSYQENAYISLSDLRYLHVVHYNFDGRIQVGEMIVNAQIADDVLFIFRELFARGYQIRKMHLIDDYWTGDGVSSDAASVTDDNTSCFCFRRATNTDTLSRHALGLAIDLNPLENPFLTFDGDGTVHVLPEAGTYYAYNRSPNIPHVITESDDAYILFSQRGFDWGGHWSSPIDYQHFERN